jgi:hypothetical protein
MGAAQRASRAQATLVLSSEVKHEAAASQSPSLPTKTSGTYIPEPQSQRILQRYVNGQSIRSIARDEGRDRSTITKVVRSTEMQQYVQNMKERFVGLGSAAMDALEYGLVIEKDSRLAHRVLCDIGVIPCNQQGMQSQNEEPMSDQDARVRGIMVKMASIAIERNRVFKTPLPAMDAVEKEIEEELRRKKQEKE